eukprot:SAG31_NODE_1193_length_9454_cov_38.779156_5_plen_92_part_00
MLYYTFGSFGGVGVGDVHVHSCTRYPSHDSRRQADLFYEIIRSNNKSKFRRRIKRSKEKRGLPNGVIVAEQTMRQLGYHTRCWYVSTGSSI